MGWPTPEPEKKMIHMPRCDSDCREDLLSKMNADKEECKKIFGQCLQKGSLWKVVGIIVSAILVIAGISLSIYAEGVKERKAQIKENAAKSQQIEKSVIAIETTLTAIQETNKELKAQMANMLREIRRIHRDPSHYNTQDNDTD